MGRASFIWILAGLGAALVGFGAGRLASPAPAEAESALDETAAAWKLRDAARTRLEIRLADALAKRDGSAVRAEAEALAALDPFHERARSLLRRGRGSEVPSPPGATQPVPRPDTDATAREDAVASTPVAGPMASKRQRDADDSPSETGSIARGRSRKDMDVAAAARSTSAYEEVRREMRRRTHEAIDATYPNAGIASALKRHAWDGRLDQAIEDLRRLRRDEPSADGVLAGLRAVAAGLEGGRVALAGGRLAEADSLWRQAFDAERALLPAEISSVAVREARRQLAQAWFEDGRRFLDRDQIGAAVASWRRGLAADPSHLDLRVALQRAAERMAGR